MTNMNFLKPNKKNLNLFLILGALFFSLGIIDFCLYNFYDTNITGFLPRFISFFTPIIFGMIGLHLKKSLQKHQKLQSITKLSPRTYSLKGFCFGFEKNLYFSLFFLNLNFFVIPIHQCCD